MKAAKIFLLALFIFILARCANSYRNFSPERYARYRSVHSDGLDANYLILTNAVDSYYPEFMVSKDELHLLMATVDKGFFRGGYVYQIWTEERLMELSARYRDLDSYWPDPIAPNKGIRWLNLNPEGKDLENALRQQVQ